MAPKNSQSKSRVSNIPLASAFDEGSYLTERDFEKRPDTISPSTPVPKQDKHAEESQASNSNQVGSVSASTTTSLPAFSSKAAEMVTRHTSPEGRAQIVEDAGKSESADRAQGTAQEREGEEAVTLQELQHQVQVNCNSLMDEVDELHYRLEQFQEQVEEQRREQRREQRMELNRLQVLCRSIDLVGLDDDEDEGEMMDHDAER
ncbi:uncharacterized protein KY384_002752 [Bacidia gigantensis]|uniref:uncharacterized protein n=1 Tax=Bacidia gigantensis TaxID=2732470 RepID=UPI001D050D1B|nr:uncharacterized protein KY384_002752 [Bacidia gigantensis]KAG8532874.1 hypothetical protein KY384_002752 [Bacidia gigantensis]